MSSNKPTRLAFLLATSSLVGISAPLFAQSNPPPVRQAIDENGVDLMYLTFNTSEADLSIGSGEQGLSFERVWRGSSWRHNLMATITHNGGNLYTVSFGGKSDSFKWTVWPTFVSTEGNGATLVVSGSDYIYTAPDGTIAVFGPILTENYWGTKRGLARSITFPGGDRWTYQIATGQFCQYGYWNGSSCTQPLTNAERIQSVTNRFGYQVKLEYAINSMVNHTNYPDWNRITKATAINGAVEYCDPAALSCSLANPWPAVTYTRSGTSETVADSTGLLRTYTYDAAGTSIVGIKRATAAANSTAIGYSGGRVSSLTKDGGTYSYTYSANSTNRSVSINGPLQYWRGVQSSVTFNTIQSDIDSISRSTSYIQDANGRVTLVSVTPQGALHHNTQFTYDSRGNVTETRHVATSGSGDADIVTKAGYDPSCSNPLICNKPLWTQDAKGNQTDYTYDPNHGGVLTVTLPAATSGGVRPQTRYTYQQYQSYSKDSAGSIVASGVPVYRLTGVSTCQTAASCTGTADEAKSTIDYGPQIAGTANNLLPVSTTTQSGDGALNATTGVAYDMIGNQLTVDGPLAGSADTVRTRYDARRRVIGEVGPDPDGGGVRLPLAQRVSYNLDNQVTNIEIGNVNGQSDADWAAMTVAQNAATTYDANARPIKSELKSGATTEAVTQISYDARGRVDCSTQRMNPAIYGSLPGSACALGTAGSFGPDRITKNSYNAASQVTKVQTAFGTAEQADEITTSYNGNGNVAHVIDAENNRTAFAYDGHYRHVKTEFPSATKGANVANASDYEQLTYDANGNVTNRRLRDGQTIGYTYDNLNRMTFMDRSNAGIDEDITYTYDLLGRMRTSQTPWGHLTHLAYDALGRRTGETTTYGPLKTSLYDQAGRRTRLTWHDGFYVDYDYDVMGNVIAIRENGATSGIGVLASYGYDNLGRRTSVTRGNGTMTSYGYDAVSRLASLTQDLGGSAHDITLGYSYNPASQVASNTRSNDIYAWGGHYNVDRTYASNGLNQLMSAGGTTLGYDGRGNLTTSGGTSYGYGQLNQLVYFPGGTLYYDPLMRLDLIYHTSAFTALDYDGANLSTEYSYSTGAMLKRYVHGPGTDEPIVWYEGSGTTDRRWLHADERGSVIAVSDGVGAAININRYDEYGIPAPGNVGRFGYTGQTWIPELGMWYYKARIYSPTLGRFMQTDPIGYGDGMNWYNYVGSDPVNASDPLGLNADRCASKPTSCFHNDPNHANANATIVVTGTRSKRGPLPTPLGTISLFPGEMPGAGRNGERAASPSAAKAPSQCAAALQESGEIEFGGNTATGIVLGGIQVSWGKWRNLRTGSHGSYSTRGVGLGIGAGVTRDYGRAKSLADFVGYGETASIEGSVGPASGGYSSTQNVHGQTTSRGGSITLLSPPTPGLGYRKLGVAASATANETSISDCHAHEE